MSLLGKYRGKKVKRQSSVINNYHCEEFSKVSLTIPNSETNQNFHVFFEKYLKSDSRGVPSYYHLVSFA